MEPVPRRLIPHSAGSGGEYKGGRIPVDEKTFRYMLNQDAMATEKLSEGIRGFCVDIEKLESVLTTKIGEGLTTFNI